MIAVAGATGGSSDRRTASRSYVEAAPGRPAASICTAPLSPCSHDEIPVACDAVDTDTAGGTGARGTRRMGIPYSGRRVMVMTGQWTYADRSTSKLHRWMMTARMSRASCRRTNRR